MLGTGIRAFLCQIRTVAYLCVDRHLLLPTVKRELPKHRDRAIPSLKVCLTQLPVIPLLEAVQGIYVAGIVFASFDEPNLVPTKKGSGP